MKTIRLEVTRYYLSCNRYIIDRYRSMDWTRTIDGLYILYNFLLKKFKLGEMNFSITDKETLAVINRLLHF